MFDEPIVLLGEDGAPFFEPLKPVAFFVNEPVWVNNHAHVLRPLGIEPKFLAHVLNITDYADFIEGSTRDKLTQGNMGAIPIALPPAPEQRAVIRFLDRKTAAIDALIAKKERLIELLQEKRQALITQAVTKGLDPNVPMKESGVEWLDRIPARWKVERLKQLLRAAPGAIRTGPFGSQLTSAEMVGGEFKVYNQRSVIDNDFVSGENFVSGEKFEQLRSFEVFAHDVLVTTRGTIGRVAVVPPNAERGILHPCLIRVQTNPTKMLPGYLALLMQEFPGALEQLRLLSNATTIEVVYSYNLREIALPVPPVEEQQALLTHIESVRVRLDHPIDLASRQVQLLREYRQALITAAVTGKIDVSNEAE